jgi:hypothetical protein
MDVPHLLMRILKTIIHNRRNKNAVIKKPFVDDFAFDLGYHQSYCIVIFTIGIIFSPVVPLIPIFGAFFFSAKYYVDKYNLTFVYNKEFEGGGVIKKNVIPYMLFSIYVF